MQVAKKKEKMTADDLRVVLDFFSAKKSAVPVDVNDFVDKVERKMHDVANTGEARHVTMPVTHTYTPGLYVRKITMYKGTLITSKIHKTEHQWIMISGKCSVFDTGEEVLLEGYNHGITKAGTRRILQIHEETIWMTVHANPDNESIEILEDKLIEKHYNPLLDKKEQKKINAHKNLGPCL